MMSIEWKDGLAPVAPRGDVCMYFSSSEESKLSFTRLYLHHSMVME